MVPPTPNKKQKTSAAHPDIQRNRNDYSSDQSDQSTSSNYQPEQTAKTRKTLDKLIRVVEYLLENEGEWKDNELIKITKNQINADIISKLYLELPVPGSAKEKSYRKYREALLARYDERDEEEYQETLTKLFKEELPSLRKIFSPKWFSTGKKTGDGSQQRRLCLYKFFMEFIETKKFTDWKACEEILDWLAGNKIEEILEEKSQMKMIHFLILKDNWEAVEWVFARCTSREQIEEIFTYENHKIFNLLAGDCNDEQVKIIGLVFEKFKELFKDEQEQKERVNKQKEKLKLNLEENSEEGTELWQELESKLMTSGVSAFAS